MGHVYAFQIKNKILFLLQTKANSTMIWHVLNSYNGKPRPEKALLVRALSQLDWMCWLCCLGLHWQTLLPHLSGGWTAGQGLDKQSSFCSKTSWVWLGQLIFFLAGTVECFGFRMRMLLITHQCFVVAVWCYPKSRTFQCPCPLPVRTKSWEGPWPRELAQAGHRDILYHRMPCSAYKLGEVAARGWPQLRDRLGIAQWVLRNCIVLVFWS